MATPSANPGQMADGMAAIREAVKILQENLPKMQIGSDPYKSVLSAIQGISRHVPPTAEVPGVQKTALRNIGQDANKNAMLQAVMRGMGQNASSGASPGGGGPAAAAPPVAPGAGV